MLNNSAIWVNQKHAYRYPMSSPLRQWLLYSGSMTKRLKKQCKSFSIEVISSKRHPMNGVEAKLLNVDFRSWSWLREVYISCDNQRFLYGKTIIPYCYFNRDLKRIQSLKKSPLGKLLFKFPSYQRSSFEITQMKPCHNDYPAILSQHFINTPLWARRSVFKLGNNKLLLTEVFLREMIEHVFQKETV